jgi:hypothetical protein
LLHQLNQRDAAGLPVASTRIVPLVSVRSAPGTPSANTIHVGAQNQQMVLMLDPGFEEYARYRVTIDRLQAGAEPARVMQVDGLQPGYEEMLALALSPGVLEPGDYRVEIEGWRDEWPADHAFDPIESLPLRVLPPSR